MDITEIFEELQKIGCVEYCRDLEAKEDVPNFQANIPNNKIEYNPKMKNLEDRNSIKFCLLHEEGHFRFPKIVFLFGCLFVSFIIILILLIFRGLDLISSLLLLVFISFILIIWYKWMEEYESDKFASLMLRDVLKEAEVPSKILEKALRDISLDRTICDKFRKIIHPPPQYRVRKIRYFVDKKN
jgi:Zn-dependent protease with chaperone function